MKIQQAYQHCTLEKEMTENLVLLPAIQKLLHGQVC